MPTAAEREKGLMLLEMVTNLLVGIVEEAGKEGVPGGPIYAALLPYGCDLDLFESLMDYLVRSRRLSRRGPLYFPATRKEPA